MCFLQRLPAEERDEKGRPKDEEGGKVIRFFREHYYLPLNNQMMELIRTKAYLLDSDAIPESFKIFMRHAAELDCFHGLWKEVEISRRMVSSLSSIPNSLDPRWSEPSTH